MVAGLASPKGVRVERDRDEDVPTRGGSDRRGESLIPRQRRRPSRALGRRRRRRSPHRDTPDGPRVPLRRRNPWQLGSAVRRAPWALWGASAHNRANARVCKAKIIAVNAVRVTARRARGVRRKSVWPHRPRRGSCRQATRTRGGGHARRGRRTTQAAAAEHPDAARL